MSRENVRYTRRERETRGTKYGDREGGVKTSVVGEKLSSKGRSVRVRV